MMKIHAENSFHIANLCGCFVNNEIKIFFGFGIKCSRNRGKKHSDNTRTGILHQIGWKWQIWKMILIYMYIFGSRLKHFFNVVEKILQFQDGCFAHTVTAFDTYIKILSQATIFMFICDIIGRLYKMILKIVPPFSNCLHTKERANERWK